MWWLLRYVFGARHKGVCGEVALTHCAVQSKPGLAQPCPWYQPSFGVTCPLTCPEGCMWFIRSRWEFISKQSYMPVNNQQNLEAIWMQPESNYNSFLSLIHVSSHLPLLCWEESLFPWTQEHCWVDFSARPQTYPWILQVLLFPMLQAGCEAGLRFQ